ncbi:hypothetical protein GGQ11_003276 [Salinibacter ruber]|uniref:Uncharacterized protein n=1 Tax=Salinibacter ruber TaxID=146919 RepID=A0A9X2U8T5_9BACT|nr:hypothetical protein [Salinibacter ruber]MCS3952006.1 hypothetical protein [Salinibacter ruber]MCS4118463.1 hypothetical protein [Salinibacter ruber]MCS4154173.1 hypothetical protein [Salinibacter ruber]MCS4170788.1 hypothetical protein [Salinibacter ruber]
MSDSSKEFFTTLGGICFIHFVIEFPYSLFQGNEFNLSASRFGLYLIVSFGYVVYEYYYSNSDDIVEGNT